MSILFQAPLLAQPVRQELSEFVAHARVVETAVDADGRERQVLLDGRIVEARRLDGGDGRRGLVRVAVEEIVGADGQRQGLPQVHAQFQVRDPEGADVVFVVIQATSVRGTGRSKRCRGCIAVRVIAGRTPAVNDLVQIHVKLTHRVVRAQVQHQPGRLRGQCSDRLGVEQRLTAQLGRTGEYTGRHRVVERPAYRKVDVAEGEVLRTGQRKVHASRDGVDAVGEDVDAGSAVGKYGRVDGESARGDGGSD